MVLIFCQSYISRELSTGFIDPSKAPWDIIESLPPVNKTLLKVYNFVIFAFPILIPVFVFYLSQKLLKINRTIKVWLIINFGLVLIGIISSYIGIAGYTLNAHPLLIKWNVSIFLIFGIFSVIGYLETFVVSIILIFRKLPDK